MRGGTSASAAGWFSFRFLWGNVNGKAVSPVFELPSGGGEVNSSTARRALLDPLEHTDHDITRRARRKSATQRQNQEIKRDVMSTLLYNFINGTFFSGKIDFKNVICVYTKISV